MKDRLATVPKLPETGNFLLERQGGRPEENDLLDGLELRKGSGSIFRRKPESPCLCSVRWSSSDTRHNFFAFTHSSFRLSLFIGTLTAWRLDVIKPAG